MSTGPEAPRDAVLWIGGLGGDNDPAALERTAKRIAVALDNNSAPPVSFAVSSPAIAGNLPVCTITRTDEGVAQPVIDLYGYAIEDQLVGPVRDMATWKQAVFAGAVVISAGGVMLRHLRSTVGKSPRERVQLALAIGGFWSR